MGTLSTCILKYDDVLLLTFCRIFDIVPSKMEVRYPIQKSPYTIILGINQKQKLQEMARKYTSSYYQVVWAKVILLAAEGSENKEIREGLDLPRHIVNNAWAVCRIVPDKQDLAVFPPEVVIEVKALACELPSERNLPFSCFSHAEIAREAVWSGIVASISGATVWRWHSSDEGGSG